MSGIAVILPPDDLQFDVDLLQVLCEPLPPYYTWLRRALCGALHLSQTPIPYFQTLLSLEDVFEELDAFENAPTDPHCKWSLEELILRDSPRMDKESKGGSADPHRPEELKFFNSLTVALLPLDANRMLAKGYGETPQEPELKDTYRKKPWAVKNVGGVQVITNDSTPNGYIRWDPKRVFPATIDGQHRLAALRTYYNHGNLSVSALATKISVLFLVLDPRVGFDIAKMGLAHDENPVLTVVREIFIDLNKHAMEVEGARRILLDDQEIESRCLRELLATRVGEYEDGKLPLGIVHWQHQVAAKFNVSKWTGPFVTTVELLYAVIADLLDLKRPKDPLEEAEVRRFVDTIENTLEVSKVVAAAPLKYAGVKPLGTYVETQHIVREVPFANLPAEYLRAAVDGFNKQYRPLIVGVLTQFKVYKDFIAQVQKRGGIEGELAFYLVQPKKAQEQARAGWGEGEAQKKIDEPLEELAALKHDDWPFYAVFQKGLMRATAIAWRQYAVVGGKKDATVDDFVTDWVSFLDEVADRGLMKVKASFSKAEKAKVWLGVSLNAGGETIRWAESSVQRIAALLVIWWYFYTGKKAQVGGFIKKVTGARGSEQHPRGKELIRALCKGLKTVVVKSDEEPDDAEIERRIEKRLRDLIALAQNKAAPDGTADEEEEGKAVADVLRAAEDAPPAA